MVRKSDQSRRRASEMISWDESLVERYPIHSIEDGIDGNDWDGLAELMKSLGDQIQLVGDDPFVTNPKYSTQGIERDTANAILIKVNQIGTLTETLNCIERAKTAGYGAIVSHPSGETEDITIADITVVTKVGQIKTIPQISIAYRGRTG